MGDSRCGYVPHFHQWPHFHGGLFRLAIEQKEPVEWILYACFHQKPGPHFYHGGIPLRLFRGSAGNTVGYAIFNTACVATAIVSGLITKEWAKASAKARIFLYLGLACMIVGIIIVAFGNNLAG